MHIESYQTSTYLNSERDVKMKRLYLIGGTMGVGKTTVCQILKKELPNAVFLDGDWCWDMHPFQVTEETKQMVMDNICYLLNSFLRCSAYENILFCWVMHEQSIINNLLSRLEINGVEVNLLSLTCNVDSLKSHLQRDADAGIREPNVIERSLTRLPLYDKLDTIKIDVSALTPMQTAEVIRKRLR